jgi:hypothetical protein
MSTRNPRVISINKYIYADRDWEAIERAYAASALTVDEICALHAISRSALYYHARKGGWRNRVPMADGPHRHRVRQQHLGQRLMNALDSKMTEFENRLAAGTASGASTAADAERDARTLNTLVRLFDKLETLGERAGGPAKTVSPATPAEGGAYDSDRLRDALARRLERLRVGVAG